MCWPIYRCRPIYRCLDARAIEHRLRAHTSGQTYLSRRPSAEATTRRRTPRGGQGRWARWHASELRPGCRHCRLQLPRKTAADKRGVEGLRWGERETVFLPSWPCWVRKSQYKLEVVTLMMKPVIIQTTHYRSEKDRLSSTSPDDVSSRSVPLRCELSLSSLPVDRARVSLIFHSNTTRRSEVFASL